MVTFNLEQFYKKYNFKPSYDSNAGGDYVDDIDFANAAKFNYRFNGKDTLFKDLEKYLEVLNNSVSGSRILGLFRDYGTAIPFEYQIELMKFVVKGYTNTVLNKGFKDIDVPTTEFIDFIDPDDPQFAIFFGTTNLFEIQTDYPTSNKRWYRLGHDGAETVPEFVRVTKNLTTARNYVFCDIIFHDYINNPSGKPQIIRIENTISGNYFELVAYGSPYSDYRFNALFDNSYTYGNGATGLTRSIGEHRLLIYAGVTGFVISIDGTEYIIPNGDKIDGINRISFESRNDSGSEDYFDILRFDVGFDTIFNMVANTINWIYYDTVNKTILSTTTFSTIVNDGFIPLYKIDIPTGTTTITAAMITDLRSVNQLLKNINVVYALGVDITKVFHIYNNTDFTIWNTSYKSSNQIVYFHCTDTFTITLSSLNNIKLIGLYNTKLIITITNCDNIIIDGFTITTISTDSSSEYIWIQNCKFETIAQQLYGNYLYILNNIFLSSNTGILRIGSTSSYITFSGNNIYGNSSSVNTQTNYMIYFNTINRLNFENNIIYCSFVATNFPNGNCIWFEACTDTNITHNRIWIYSKLGIGVVNSNRILFSDNVIIQLNVYDEELEYIVRFSTSSYLNIVSNIFKSDPTYVFLCNCISLIGTCNAVNIISNIFDIVGYDDVRHLIYNNSDNLVCDRMSIIGNTFTGSNVKRAIYFILPSQNMQIIVNGNNFGSLLVTITLGSTSKIIVTNNITSTITITSTGTIVNEHNIS